MLTVLGKSQLCAALKLVNSLTLSIHFLISLEEATLLTCYENICDIVLLTVPKTAKKIKIINSDTGLDTFLIKSKLNTATSIYTSNL